MAKHPQSACLKQDGLYGLAGDTAAAWNPCPGAFVTHMAWGVCCKAVNWIARRSAVLHSLLMAVFLCLQGVFPPSTYASLGLPPGWYSKSPLAVAAGRYVQ